MASGYTISELILVGSGMFSNGGSGIRFEANNGELILAFEHAYVDNVDVSGYRQVGVKVEAIKPILSYSDIRVTNPLLHDNFYGGIETVGPGSFGQSFARTIFGVYVGHVEASSNGGFYLGGVDGALVERCLSPGTAPGTTVGSGFWAFNASHVVFQFNEAWDIRFPGIEGDGFTLDFDTIECVLQYNYSHGNDGAGLFLASGKPFFP